MAKTSNASGASPDIYPIPESLKKTTHVTTTKYKEMYARSVQEPEKFWAEEAEKFLTWEKKWTKVKDTSFAKDNVHITWFEGATLNVAANCVDRHLKDKAEQPAIVWEPDDPKENTRIITYRELHTEVCKTANMLKKLGVKKGERVTTYMPMVPEAAYAMLACARIGAVHSVVFGGFSASSLRGRIEDCGSKIVITADEGLRGGKKIPLKANVDEACNGVNVEKVLVLRRTGGNIAWQEGRDVWWHELEKTVDANCPAEAFDAETPLFVLYTSGSTGKPKGLLHTSGGYLLYAAATFQYVFDYRPGEIFWCTADIGWITGHSYIVYGPLACGATTLMFEGVPTYPDAARFWQVIDKHNVSIFYTAPTAIRMLMREGDAIVKKTSRKSLRILGSVGEPINPEAWRWYNDVVGDGRCAIVDTWWQTETGGHLITPLPGAIAAKPGSATLPFFGVQPAIVGTRHPERSEGSRPTAQGPSPAAQDDELVELPANEEGALCIKDSWPGQARTIWGDHDRFVKTYFSDYPGYYFSGDAAKRDGDGYYWIAGRMDDVLKVSGHRIGTAEIESALVGHDIVTEAAVVGFPHEIKGEGVYAFVTLMPDIKTDGENGEKLKKDLQQWVRKEVGALAIPEKIQFAPQLPKTRSGKIMRRILRKIAGGEVQSHDDFSKLGDISTLLNPEAVDDLVKGRV